MYGALDITTSGLIAQRTRMTVISNNLLHQNTILNADGEYEPYRRQHVVLGAGDPQRGSELGVHVAAIEHDMSPLQKRYEPGSLYADADGYVSYPNVSPIVETMNAMEAARAYEANISAAEATKSMMSVALQLLA